MKEMNTSNNFTWIKFFNAMLKKICSEYDKKTLWEVFKKVYADKFNEQHPILTENPGEIDPFTFIAMLNANDSIESRQELCNIVKEELKLSEPSPLDFNGITFFNPIQRFFYNLNDYISDTMDSLWELASYVANNTEIISDEIGENIDIAIQNVDYPKLLSWGKICKILFVCFPDRYFPADTKICAYSGIKSRLDNFEDFKKYQQALKDKFNEPPYIVSYKAINGIYDNISYNVQDTEAKMTTIKQDTPLIPLNQILYGPPGTGKTYSVEKYINAILSDNPGLKSDNEEQRFSDVVKYLKWYSAIALSIYRTGKNNQYSVVDILNQKLINVFAQTKENKNLREALWGQLQIHTDTNSSTVKYKNRSEPFVFDKTEDSKWYLTAEGIKFVEENLSAELELLNAKNQTRKIEDFYKFITFHQSYSYEEFIEGIKPVISSDEEDNNGIQYEYNKGIFKEICQKANSDPQNKYLLIIDEINRGNISKIFGELITLIETDKRVNPNGDINFEHTQIQNEQLLVNLPYTKAKFGVPSNLYILGTMNTSDRSIAAVDIALRRRFKFIEMMPDKTFVANFGIEFQDIFENLNKKIKLLLDRDHQIGHSYFINTKYKNADAETLKQIWFQEILPLLNEYFYCDWEKLKLVVPGFIAKVVDIPAELKDECEDSAYEFKTEDDFKDIEDFTNALKQDKFEKGN